MLNTLLQRPVERERAWESQTSYVTPSDTLPELNETHPSVSTANEKEREFPSHDINTCVQQTAPFSQTWTEDPEVSFPHDIY